MSINPYKEVQEIKEHEVMLLDLNYIMSTTQGQNFFKYLFKHLGVGDLPDINIPDKLRDEYIGYLRAGQSIFEIVSQADNIKAGLILAQIKKEQYDESIKQNIDGQG